VCYGTAGDQAYLVLEFIALGHGGQASQEHLGQQLAGLHRITRPRYGWTRDNTIGATPQQNTECDDWVEFWRTQRLGFQLQLAAGKGYGGRLQSQGERLLMELPRCWPVTRLPPRCCMAICGREITASMHTVHR